MAGTSLSVLKKKSTAQKAIPETVKMDEEVVYLFCDMHLLEMELGKAVGPLKKKLLSMSRKLYSKSDKALKELKKDKKKNKNEIAIMLEVRKYAYDVGMMMKSISL